MPPAKHLRFLASSLEDLRGFPAQARRTAGFELDQVQRGHLPRDYRPMSTIGHGVFEIRVHEEGREHRVLYVAKFADAVYVLHAFEKKTRKTLQQDLEIGRRRYRDLTRMRQL